MAWDSTRPVPWRRLVNDWLIYVGIMAVVFLIVFRDRLSVGPFAGLLISGPLYLMIGAVLAKFGYQRRTLREIRAAATSAAASSSTSGRSTTGTTGAARSRPAPTSRTGGGRPRAGSKRRR
jgi:hypothetical protein